MKLETLTIDGSQGEGGGQILRTALTLSLVTGRPFVIENIRAGRDKPGLRPQHLEAVRAAQRLADADVSGAAEGSLRLSFTPRADLVRQAPLPREGQEECIKSPPPPGENQGAGRSAGTLGTVLGPTYSRTSRRQDDFPPFVKGGQGGFSGDDWPCRRNGIPLNPPLEKGEADDSVPSFLEDTRIIRVSPSPLSPPSDGETKRYRFDIRTAGSTSLLLHTVFFPLALSHEPARVALTGGTHVEWSPSFHYLAMQWLPVIERMGFRATLTLSNAGFYPRGGGEIECVVAPMAARPRAIELLDRGEPRTLRIVSGIGQLPLDIAERQKRRAEGRLGRVAGFALHSEILPMPAHAPGTFLLVLAQYEHAAGCFCALGAKGKRAEKVADEACDGALDYIESDAAIDEHMGDQLVLPAVLADGETSFRSRITAHLLTNLKVVQSFLPVDQSIDGKEGDVGTVRIRRR